MESKYDVIVVGAGNGGLAAAANTAKAGLKTLVLEKHNLPGGCATSFRRGRFEFEPSLHELCSVGTAQRPNVVYKVFDDLGAKPDWQYEKGHIFRAIVKGEDIPRPGIPESFRVMLKELQSLGLNVVVQDQEGNPVDMRQEFDDDDITFDPGDELPGDNVMIEGELQGDYSIKDADEGFDDDFGDDDDKEPDEAELAEIEAGDDAFLDD